MPHLGRAEKPVGTPTLEPKTHPHQFDGAAFYEEEEINLIDFLIALLRHKFLIMGMVFIAGVGAVVMTSGKERTYRSEAVITPRTQETTKIFSARSTEGMVSGMAGEQISFGGSGSREKILAVLNSRNLAGTVIEKYKRMPILFPGKWDSDKDKWKTDAPTPTLQDGILAIRGMLHVDVKKKGSRGITVGIVNKDPEMAKRLVNEYLTTLSESMREAVLRDTAENKRFLEEQLGETPDPLVVEKIYALLAAEIEKDTFARGQKYFGFRILDPPVAPDLNKGEPTRRKSTILLSVVVAFFLAIFMAFMIEYFRRFKTENREQYNELVEELKVWKIRRN